MDEWSDDRRVSRMSGTRGTGAWVSVWCVVAAFGVYFRMYDFRKPFTAAGFSGATLWGLDQKTFLVVAQVLGYMTAKFLGIKTVAEVTPARRPTLLPTLLLKLTAAAWAALLLTWQAASVASAWRANRGS